MVRNDHLLQEALLAYSPRTAYVSRSPVPTTTRDTVCDYKVGVIKVKEGGGVAMGQKVLMASRLSPATLGGPLPPSLSPCWAWSGKLSCLPGDLGRRACGEQTCGF